MSVPQRPLLLGLVINPVAGLGGAVGLKGSDGVEIQSEATRRGARPLAMARAVRLIQELGRRGTSFELKVAEGVMGEVAAREAGRDTAAVVSCGISSEPGRVTTGQDTMTAASELLNHGVDIVVFVGGDGTARDIATVLGPGDVSLGIPAGVKMQSGVFARSPETAAAILAEFARNPGRTSEADVVDIDEEARRAGVISSTLFGRLTVPAAPRQLQGGKVGSRDEPRDVLRGIAQSCAEKIDPSAMCLLGPGTTVSAVAEHLGVPSTLLGVDVLHNGSVIARDCSADELHRITENHRLEAVLSPIGGQGFLFGRGNQQLDARILERLNPDSCLIVCTSEKLGALGGGPFYVDILDPDVRDRFTGHRRVIIGYQQEAVIRLTPA